MTTTNENLSGTVVVIGGGVVGCFLAYRLASEGVSVTLVEQEGPGAGATGNSAGNIQPGSGDDDTYKIALGSTNAVDGITDSLTDIHTNRFSDGGTDKNTYQSANSSTD